MKRVCIVCEGPTEVQFVINCLGPHLQAHGVLAYPQLIQAPSGAHRGGRVTVERVVKLIYHEYRNADYITTLLDFYGFRDANGRSRSQLETDISTAVAQRARSLKSFDPRRVLPYVQMHEFEALLFSDIEQFQYVLDGWNACTRAKLLCVRNGFETPEDINNSRETSPSHRISRIFAHGAYNKVEHGAIIAEAIGLQNIRAACRQFDEWLAKLEAWGNDR